MTGEGKSCRLDVVVFVAAIVVVVVVVDCQCGGGVDCRLCKWRLD